MSSLISFFSVHFSLQRFFTSLVIWLICRKFDATGNVYFPDFFLESSLFMYIKVTNFSMLILYPATLLKVFTISRSAFPLVESWIFFSIESHHL